MTQRSAHPRRTRIFTRLGLLGEREADAVLRTVEDGVVLAEEGVAQDPQPELVECLHAQLALRHARDVVLDLQAMRAG